MINIKKLGLKDYIFWRTLCIIEIILNIPYFILKIIIEIFYFIFDKLDNIFSGERLIYLSKFSRIRKYIEYLKGVK